MDVIGNAGAAHKKQYKRTGQLKTQTNPDDFQDRVELLATEIRDLKKENEASARNIKELHAEVKHFKKFCDYCDKQLLELYKEFDERLSGLYSEINNKAYESKWEKQND